MTGFNAGADLRWMFSRNIGVGGMVRYIRGSVDLDDRGRSPNLGAGGWLQVGGGLRIGF